MEEVAGSWKEDFGKMLEIEMAMVEEEVEGLLVCQRGFERSENKSLVGSKFTTSGKECLDGWVGAGRGEVKGSSVDFGVIRIFLGDIPGEIIGESSCEVFGVNGGAV
ncbi:hypothetical protein Tco_1492582 [Tanacetum coccineum]